MRTPWLFCVVEDNNLATVIPPCEAKQNCALHYGKTFRPPASACTSQLLKHYNSLLDETDMRERPARQVHVFLFCVPNLVGNSIDHLVSNLEIVQLQGDLLLVSHGFPDVKISLLP